MGYKMPPPEKMLPLPFCHKCKKEVDRMDGEYDLVTNSYYFIVRCHGEYETCKLPNHMLEFKNIIDFKQGAAFAPKPAIEQQPTINHTKE